MITKKRLNGAVAEKILSAEQSEALFEYINNHPESGVQFDFTHVLYYMGGALSIGAMTILMTLGWGMFGGGGIISICLLYAIAGIWLTNSFENKGYLAVNAVNPRPIRAGIQGESA